MAAGPGARGGADLDLARQSTRSPRRRRGDHPAREPAGSRGAAGDQQRHRQHAAAVRARLAVVLRAREPRGTRATARSGRRVPADGLRHARSVPAVGRRAGPAIRAGRDCDRGTRVRACGRRGDLQPRSRSNAPCRLLPDLAWSFSDRARDRLSTAPRSTAGALCVPASGRRLPRKRRAADDAADREPADLRLAPWRALAAARADRAAGGHPDQRAGAQPDQPVRHLSDPPAPGTETGLPKGDPCRGLHAGRRAHSLRIPRARDRDFRAARSARARQQRPQPALRGARRLSRLGRRVGTGRYTRPGRGRHEARGAEPPLRGRPVLLLPPCTAVERRRALLDGHGAQARQARTVQPAAQGRGRHRLCRAARRPVGAAARAVCHHAGLRHAASTRRGRSHDRRDGTSAEPASLRCGSSPGSRRLRRPPAARRRQPAQRQQDAVRADDGRARRA